MGRNYESAIMHNENDEVEIDLVELFGELKKNIKFIGGVTLLFIIVLILITGCFNNKEKEYKLNLYYKWQ